MNNLLIYNKKKSKLLDALNLIYDLEYIKKPSFLSALFTKQTQYPDIYFYDSKLDKYNIELLLNSKLIIVNSNAQKQYLVKKLPALDMNNIKVVYPYIDHDSIYDEYLQENFKKNHNIDLDTKIIFFRANKLSKNGIKTVLSIVSNLNSANFTLLVESSKKEIDSLRVQLQIMKIKFNVILVEDYKNKNELFMISDIFLFPSSSRFFNRDILKAGFYKTAIFVSCNNYASEVVDTFATIELDDEHSTIFKIDALLSNSSELEVVKDTNYKQLKKYFFSNSFNSLKNLF